MLVDAGSFVPLDEELQPTDPLDFIDRLPYRDRLIDGQRSTGLNDAALTGICSLDGHRLGLGVMDFRFMAGTIGSVVGEKFTRLVEQTTAKRLPVLIFCASGGGRMQEGVFSLMQIAKVAAALHLHRQAGLLYLSLLTNPTFGGATASYGMLGNLILAEPGAMIGFAGRRVIEQTLRVKLPDHFQSAESLRDHGFVDCIVERPRLKQTIAAFLAIHCSCRVA
jgi:acetyl-CoA carboxylase carboxyl transferase subunit beta